MKRSQMTPPKSGGRKDYVNFLNVYFLVIKSHKIYTVHSFCISTPKITNLMKMVASKLVNVLIFSWVLSPRGCSYSDLSTLYRYSTCL